MDRGELDKFIEHAERQIGEHPRSDFPDRTGGHERHKLHYRDDDEYRGKPRKSFLRDLFD